MNEIEIFDYDYDFDFDRHYHFVLLCTSLGVSRASFDGVIPKIIGMGIIYFIFSFWDSVTNTFSVSTEPNLWRIIPSSIVDSLIYFWILQSLLETLQDLEDRKQTSKLQVFIKLRNIIIVVVLIATGYNIGFSYIVIKKMLEMVWRHQWFFNEGVWSVFYFLIICSIIVRNDNDILIILIPLSLFHALYLGLIQLLMNSTSGHPTSTLLLMHTICRSPQTNRRARVNRSLCQKTNFSRSLIMEMLKFPLLICRETDWNPWKCSVENCLFRWARSRKTRLPQSLITPFLR